VRSREFFDATWHLLARVLGAQASDSCCHLTTRRSIPRIILSDNTNREDSIVDQAALLVGAMLKSALTAQLANGNGLAEKNAETTVAPLDLIHNPAFPCIRYAKGDVVKAEQKVSEADDTGYEIPDMSKLSLAGTAAPIGSVPTGKVYLTLISCKVVGRNCPRMPHAAKDATTRLAWTRGCSLHYNTIKCSSSNYTHTRTLLS
jgi:hypothetical protein